MTIHETPVITPLMRWASVLFIRATGWTAEGQSPDEKRYVIIAAPHTSNWDFVYTLCMAFVFRIRPLIMMKKEWFRWPMGGFFRWLGALPIDRSGPGNVVAQCIDRFQRLERLVLVVPPSGTRRKVTYWKTGFYHIAHGAGVPVVLGYLDYRRKAGGIGPILRTSGDQSADMNTIHRFYEGIAGKHPSQIDPPQRSYCMAAVHPDMPVDFTSSEK